ncbi:MAG: iron ABC transporter permease, partial [Actinomycetota bacterium]|nr:iron ABC transporter permease [Actinomycetota bacterium]
MTSRTAGVQAVEAISVGASPRRRVVVVTTALAVVVAAALTGLLVGPVRLGVSGVLQELFGWLPFVEDAGLDEQRSTILWQLRAPRVALACVVGACLAVSGAAYQGAFRNPLADPYLLGAAAGAGLGATIALVSGAAGSSAAGTPLLPLASFVGALAGVALAYVIGGSMGGRTTTGLVLAGVAVASFLTAVQTFVQQQNSDTLREVYTWILGRLA